jgi:hypothetical protein
MSLITRQAKGSKLTIEEMDGNLEYLEELARVGTNYLHVLAKGTPEQNAEEFIAAYSEATEADKDSEHRFTLILSPGHYKFQETFQHNVDNINIVSLTGEQDVIFDLELNEDDPVVLDPPPPPLPPFEYIYDLDIDINDGDITYSDSLKNGQPSFLNVTGQTLPEIVFNTNGLGYRGNPSGTYPVYGGFSAGTNDKVVVSYKFTYNAFTGDNYQQHNISLYDNTLAILPEFQNGNVNQLYCYVNNQGNLYIQSVSVDGNGSGSGSGISLTDGAEYTLELINDPGNSLQEAIIKDSEGTVIYSTSTSYFQISINNYSVALGVENQGPFYNPTLESTSSVMDISANYSIVSGIKTKEYFSNNYVTWSSNNWNTESDYYPLPLNVIMGGYDDLEVKNCTAGPFSFASNWGSSNFNDGSDLETVFTDCTALAFSFGFGADQIESGSVFTNCKAGNYSFYIYDGLRGTYTDCTAGNNSFYSEDDDIEGIFTNCTAGDYSFYSDDDDIINATFTNCKGGYRCFYADSYFENVTFTNCVASDSSFEADSTIYDDVTFTNCTAGDDSFLADGSSNDGTFTNCTAGDDSFRGSNSINGTFTNCTAGDDSFTTSFSIDSSSTFTNCTAGDNSFYGNDIYGTFVNCIAGSSSFVGVNDINTGATFKNCEAGDDSFTANNEDNAGTYNNCIAGISSFNADHTNLGTYINCISQSNSFVGGVDNNSNLYYCLLYGSTFSGGTQTFCVDIN